jgi:RNA polymerase sigma-70 factor (ECF subfamily)
MNSELADLRLEGLVAKAQGGDQNARNQLIAEVDPWLQNQAQRLVQILARDVSARDRDLANEASQETCLVLLTNLWAYRPTVEFKAWLWGILKNMILGLRRKELRFQGTLPLIRESDDGSVVTMEPADEHSLTPEQAALRKETLERVCKCVNLLPAGPRQAILWYECSNDNGYTLPEVAQQLGVPLGTFKSRLTRARELLRECLAREDLDPQNPPSVLALDKSS